MNVKGEEKLTKFLLKIGLIAKSRVPLETNPNVFENYYELAENHQKIFKKINFDFPHRDLTKEEVEILIEPAISVNKMLISYLETRNDYYQAIRDSGFDKDSLEVFNRNLIWAKNKDEEDVLLSHSINSFGFYSEKEYFEKIIEDFQIESYKKVDFDKLDFIQEQSKNSESLHKPLLIIKVSLPYGYMIEYLNKQKMPSLKSLFLRAFCK